MGRWRGSLLSSYLEAVSETLSSLLTAGRWPLHPSISLIGLVALTVSTAYTNPLPLTARSMLPLTLSLIAAGLSNRLRSLLKMMAVASLFLAVISLPLIFSTPGRSISVLELGSIRLTATAEGVSTASRFFMRCLNTISISLGWICLVRIDSLIEGLRLIDPSETVPLLLFLSTRYIPLSIREAVRIIAARESRILRRDRRIEWRILSTSIGELLLRSLDRAGRVSLSMRARALSGRLPGPIRGGAPGLSLRDLAALSSIALYILIYSFRWFG